MSGALPQIKHQLRVNRCGGRVKVKGEGRCRMCQREGKVRPLTRHHVVPRVWFTVELGRGWRTIRDADANIVPLCRPCHTDVERTPEARRMLRALMTQAEIAFAILVRGKAWFDQKYPPRGREQVQGRLEVAA